MAEVREARADKRKGGKKELEAINLKKAENGGHVAEHHFAHTVGEYHEPEVHAFGADEGDKLIDHLKKHMGISGAEDEDGDE